MMRLLHTPEFKILQHTAICLGISGFGEEPKGILTEMRERDSAIRRMKEAEAEK